MNDLPTFETIEQIISEYAFYNWRIIKCGPLITDSQKMIYLGLQARLLVAGNLDFYKYNQIYVETFNKYLKKYPN